MKRKRYIKQALLLLPYIGLVIIAKIIVHNLQLEVIPLNVLFTALLGATVFIIGFLISGIMSDYKESEKLPGEISAIIYTVIDEINFINLKITDQNVIKERLTYLYELSLCTKKWFYNQCSFKEVMLRIDNLTGELAAMEQYAAPNYIVRLQQEQISLQNNNKNKIQ